MTPERRHNVKARTLTDEDVEAITDALEARISTRFYGDIGKGIWGLVWRAVILAMVSIAAYGAFGGKK